MAHRLTRREFGIAAAAATLAGYGLGRNAHATDTKTLRFIAQSDLRVLDPIWTTAYITRNHGYMVFDTLFAIDSKFKPHPQMVEGFEISSDKLNYSFVLRDGLKFHDGQPVRGADCAASIKRDLPIPASPVIATIPPLPCSRRVSFASRAVSSDCRPINVCVTAVTIASRSPTRRR